MPSTPNTNIPDLYLGNDWPGVVELFKAVAGVRVGLTDQDGAAVGYFALDPLAPDAIDADLNVTMAYIPDDDPTAPAGKWTATLQTSDAADTALTPYIGQNLHFIAKHPAGARAVAKVKVFDIRYFAVKP